MRDNYGLASNDYGPFAASGLFSVTASAAMSPASCTARSYLAYRTRAWAGTDATPATGAVNLAMAGSHGNLGNGVLGLLGLQQQWQTFSAGANVQLASPRFTELGYDGLPAPRKQIAANAGAFLGRSSSAVLSYLDQDSPLFGTCPAPDRKLQCGCVPQRPTL